MWVLLVHLCAEDGRCGWVRGGLHASEERCVAAGLAVEPAVVRFRCVESAAKDQSRVGPDQRRRP
jgi:hypothetical protein